MKTIYSVGANGSSPVMLMGLLLGHGVSHLFDVRRYPDVVFSKCQRRFLEKLFRNVHKIEYRWVPDLAPSMKLLKSAKTGGWHPRDYLDEIGVAGLEMAKALTDASPAPCFLCSEPLSLLDLCHRKALIDAMASGWKGSFTGIHLDGQKVFKESAQLCELFRGRVYDLSNLFKTVNEEYFKGRYHEGDMVVAWEEMPEWPRRILGYFRYPCLIALNPVLDQEKVPQPVVEAVLYHELLHLQRAHDGLKVGHTVEFYQDEGLFRDYAKMFRFDFSEAWQALRRGENQ